MQPVKLTRPRKLIKQPPVDHLSKPLVKAEGIYTFSKVFYCHIFKTLDAQGKHCQYCILVFKYFLLLVFVLLHLHRINTSILCVFCLLLVAILDSIVFPYLNTPKIMLLFADTNLQSNVKMVRYSKECQTHI